MFGAGLGAFVGGLAQGYAAGSAIRKDQRQRREQDQLDTLNADTRAQFDARPDEADRSPDKFMDFWSQYALPRQRMIMLQNGDLAGARALQSWSDSAEAKQGAKLFGSSLIKAQTGDVGGALDDAIKAAGIKGYLDHGYQLGGKQEIVDPDGKLVGYRLTIKDGKGKTIQQDVATGDVPRLVSTFLNPEAAFQSQQQATAKRAAADDKDAREVSVYGQKKAIDQQYPAAGKPDDPQKLRSAAIANLRKRMTGQDAYGQPDPDNPAFDSLPQEQQEKLVQQELSLQQGPAAQSAAPGLGAPSTPAAPGLGQPAVPKAVVDTLTGQPVPIDAPGLGRQSGQAAPVPLAPLATQPQSPGAPAQTAAPTPQSASPVPVPSDTAPTAGGNRQAAIDKATQLLTQGASPSEVAQALTAAGVAPAEWPSALKTMAGIGS